MKTFLFYDIETSGLNHAFDQILTFAGIRTDLELNEINRHTITVRLRKDIVPSPKAFLTHGLTPEQLELGICEYQAAQKIHAIVNKPGTISLGYNSLGFDDEFLRFTFYRNLLDPYTHQYSKGCSRMDIMPVVVIFRIFCPNCLKWPQIDGKPSLKLELISRENRFKTSGRAHEALNDVEAVIELSRILSQQKEIWNYCLGFFNKTEDEIRINKIQTFVNINNKEFKICIMVSASFGSQVNYMVPVLYLGQSLTYKNQTLWLRLDSDDILGLDAELDIKDTFVIRKRPVDRFIVLPALERFQDKMPQVLHKAAQENMEKINSNLERFFEFIQYHRSYKYPFIPDLDADAALYQKGFFSEQEKKQIDCFHKSLDDEKHKIVNTFTSERIKTLAGRIIARNFEGKAGQAEKTEFYRCLEKLSSSLEEEQIIGYKNDIKFNRRQGLAELKEIDNACLNSTPDEKKVLAWLKSYINNI